MFGWRNRQQQKAGSNSTQVQAQTVLVVSTDQAIDIFSQQQKMGFAQSYTGEAQAIGAERVERFRESLFDRINDADQLQAFAEPSFQALLAKAQIGAAQTAEPMDYDLLSSMLAERAKKGDVRKRRIGLDRAIEVVDKVDMSDLRALTILFFFERMRPNGGLILRSIARYADVYRTLLTDEDELPIGRQFADRLDLLNLGRVHQFGGYHKAQQVWTPAISGWAASGIEKSNPDLDEIWSGFARRGFVPELAEHELDPTRYRLAYARPEALRMAIETLGTHTPEQVDAIMAYADRWFGLNATGLPNLVERVLEEMDKYPALKRIREWWDTIPNACLPTDAGIILIRAFAENCGAASTIDNWLETMDVDS